MVWLVLVSALAAAGEPPGAPPVPARRPDSSAAPRPEDRQKLEEEIAKELGASAPAPQPPAPAAGGASAAAPTGGASGPSGGNPFARLLMLPDLSAIGSAALAWNQLDVGTLSPRGDPFAPAHHVEPIFQELELGLQAVVDPYARADVFLTFSPQGAAVEEAYLTTLSLPWGLQVRAGELYAPVGRINQQHPHSWDFVDRPLALSRLVGVDGLRGPGLDVSWLAPTPWFAELHAAYQALAPGLDPASRTAGLVRLLQFFDLGQATTLGVGVSGAVMDADGPDAWRDLVAADLFLKVRPPSTRAYLAVQGELVARRLTGATPAAATDSPLERQGTAWGGYVQAVWRTGPFLAYGGRYERAPAVEGGPEHRLSALASWMPSEFLRFRLQGGYDRLPGGRDGVEALLHAEFAIGVHGAHPF